MCVCVCVCACVCACVCVGGCACVSVCVSVDGWGCGWVCVSVGVRVCRWVCVCVGACVSVGVCACKWVGVRVMMRTCVRAMFAACVRVNPIISDYVFIVRFHSRRVNCYFSSFLPSPRLTTDKQTPQSLFTQTNQSITLLVSRSSSNPSVYTPTCCCLVRWTEKAPRLGKR